MALSLDSTSIVNTIMDTVADLLALKLMTEVTDDAKAGLVRTGKLQDDPSSKKINILIHPGGRDDKDIINFDQVGASGMFAPIHEIGGYGSTYYRRRINIEFQLFFAQEASRTNARMKANVALSRALHAINTLDVSTMPRDTFGESVVSCQMKTNYIFEGGGEGDFNWRGEMSVEFLTVHEPT